MTYGGLFFRITIAIVIGASCGVQSSPLRNIFTQILNITFTQYGNHTGSNGHSKTSPEPNTQLIEIPLLAKINDINKFSADLIHGDYVAAALDGVDFLETFSTLPGLAKLLLKIVEKILHIIHPVYLTLFPHAKNNGTFMDNFMYTMSHGSNMLKSAVKVMSLLY